MVTLQQAAQHALEALEHAAQDVADFQRLNTDQVDEAIKDLLQALEADTEPCAWCGEGKARISVTRICDTCGSEYAGQEEMDAAKRIEAEHQAEPAAWECKAGGLKRLTQHQYEAQPDAIKRHYTRIQPAQQPLTDEQKLMCWSRATHDADVYHKTQHQCLMDYGAEIEAAHGIK